MKDILTLVPAEQIVSDHGAELKRVLNAMLCDAGLISEDNTSNNTPLLEEPPPVDEPPPAPPASTGEVVIPPSQVDRASGSTEATAAWTERHHHRSLWSRTPHRHHNTGHAVMPVCQGHGL